MKVTFQEEGHKYTDESGAPYISVTTLLGKYKKPFDSEYWSYYKAVERYFDKHKGVGQFQKIKKQVGYKNINKFWNNYSKPPEKLLHATYQREILIEWNVLSENACVQGHDLHLKKEMAWKKDMYHKIGDSLHYLKPQELVDYDYSDIPDGIYSELLIYNNDWKIAGQADVVIVEKPYVDVGDYKTNKKLVKEAFYDRSKGRYDSMKAPIDKVQDCNFNHYQIQISLYAYMLAQYGLQPRRLWIEHIKRDDKGKLNANDIELHSIKYLDKEVKLMVDHYVRNKPS